MQFLLDTEWHRGILAEEIPILATTAGIFSQRGLVLTSRRLLVIRHGSQSPEHEFPVEGMRVLRSDKRDDRIVVHSKGKDVEFRAVQEGVPELLAGVEALQAGELLSLLRRLNFHPMAYRSHDTHEGPFDRVLIALDEADRDSRSVGVHVSNFEDSGRFLPALEGEMKHLNQSNQPHEDYTTFPLDIVKEALKWHAANGQQVAEGDVIARYAGESVRAPATGRLEYINLEQYIERHHDGHYSDEYMFEVGLWAVDGKIGRVYTAPDSHVSNRGENNRGLSFESLPVEEAPWAESVCRVCGASQRLVGDCYNCGQPDDAEQDVE